MPASDGKRDWTKHLIMAAFAVTMTVWQMNRMQGNAAGDAAGVLGKGGLDLTSGGQLSGFVSEDAAADWSMVKSLLEHKLQKHRQHLEVLDSRSSYGSGRRVMMLVARDGVLTSTAQIGGPAVGGPVILASFHETEAGSGLGAPPERQGHLMVPRRRSTAVKAAGPHAAVSGGGAAAAEGESPASAAPGNVTAVTVDAGGDQLAGPANNATLNGVGHHTGGTNERMGSDGNATGNLDTDHEQTNQQQRLQLNGSAPGDEDDAEDDDHAADDDDDGVNAHADQEAEDDDVSAQQPQQRSAVAASDRTTGPQRGKAAYAFTGVKPARSNSNSYDDAGAGEDRTQQQASHQQQQRKARTAKRGKRTHLPQSSKSKARSRAVNTDGDDGSDDRRPHRNYEATRRQYNDRSRAARRGIFGMIAHALGLATGSGHTGGSAIDPADRPGRGGHGRRPQGAGAVANGPSRGKAGRAFGAAQRGPGIAARQAGLFDPSLTMTLHVHVAGLTCSRSSIGSDGGAGDAMLLPPCPATALVYLPTQSSPLLEADDSHSSGAAAASPWLSSLRDCLADISRLRLATITGADGGRLTLPYLAGSPVAPQAAASKTDASSSTSEAADVSERDDKGPEAAVALPTSESNSSTFEAAPVPVSDDSSGAASSTAATVTEQSSVEVVTASDVPAQAGLADAVEVEGAAPTHQQ